MLMVLLVLHFGAMVDTLKPVPTKEPVLSMTVEEATARRAAFEKESPEEIEARIEKIPPLPTALDAGANITWTLVVPPSECMTPLDYTVETTYRGKRYRTKWEEVK